LIERGEVFVQREEILKTNKTYWNKNADLWFGTTALPTYGVKFVTEEDLHLFGDVSGKKMLEICCGSGHSLKYHADRNAAELWGVDLSHKQIENAQAYLKENGYTAKFICAPMEAELNIPTNYFDYIYSIYGIGWTTDLQGTFNKIASYLKKDGIFIFSWHHTLNYCVAWSRSQRKDVIENDQLVFNKSYFDESYFTMPVDGSEIILCNRKISTYINALAKAGFAIEQMIEQTDQKTMESIEDDSDKTKKAKMLPISVCFKARKL
jgi:ubiquinone/menaquinone biosynthesis C-methylase UbiE